MPDPATVREQRLRKTKAQLIEEIDRLERYAATPEVADTGSAPMRAKASDRDPANQQLTHLALLTSENPSPLLTAMPDGTVLYANDAAKAVDGLLDGRKTSTLARDLAAIVAEVSRTGQVREAEFDSGDRVLAFSIAPVAGETYLNVYGRDVTELKRAEAEDAKTKWRAQVLFDSAPIPIWEEDWSELKKMVDRLWAEGVTDFVEHFSNHPDDMEFLRRSVVMTDMNQAAVVETEVNTKQEAFDFLASMPNHVSFEGYPKVVTEFMRGERTVVTEIIDSLIDGTPVNMIESYQLLEGDEEVWSRIIAVTQNVTELRELQAHLETVTERAEAANRAKSTFVAEGVEKVGI